MQRSFSLAEAHALIPRVRHRAATVISLRADLAELAAAVGGGPATSLGGVPEAKALEARLSEELGWFRGEGIEVKGFAPLLVDFPSRRDGMEVLLCWLEGETSLGWWHRLDLGFAGRRPL